jgi:hypothetical protein
MDDCAGGMKIGGTDREDAYVIYASRNKILDFDGGFGSFGFTH